jgi:hypothetical protein
MDRKQIQRELWQSQDMAYLRRLLLLDVIGYAVIAGFMLLADDSASRGEMVYVVLVTGAFAVLPVVAFCLLRTAKIFRKPESYIFQDVRFDRPMGGRLRDTVRFKVTVKRSDGKEVFATTHSIFQTHGIGFLMEDYVNSIVCVAYNEETKTLVVIG